MFQVDKTYNTSVRIKLETLNHKLDNLRHLNIIGMAEDNLGNVRSYSHNTIIP